MAQSLCKLYAVSGSHFYLLGRNEQRLNIVAADLLVHGAQAVEVRVVDSFPQLKAAAEEACQQADGLDLFLAAQGSLPSQEIVEKSGESVSELFHANAVQIMDACLCVASFFEAQGHGTCVVIGSVAGDRGRRSNYLYGASKAALEVFCDGLRQRLEPNCSLVFIKPGPVDTPMTSHLKKGALFSTSEKVAKDILSGIERGSAVVYTPSYWKWIMLVIKLLPDSVVKRLRA